MSDKSKKVASGYLGGEAIPYSAVVDTVENHHFEEVFDDEK